MSLSIRILFLGLVLLFCTTCTIDRSILLYSAAEAETFSSFQKLPLDQQAIITNEQEDGQSLLLGLTFVDRFNEKPLIGQEVYFYQATNQGLYEAMDPNDESTARLHQQANTNDHGQIFVKTILPGDYGSRSDNRHIHMTIKGAQPEAYDLHFQQFANPMLQKFIRGSDQHFLVDLKYTSDSLLIGFMTIQAKFNK